ncbi:MAG TPA: sodium:alanine symporter family protein, partial [Gammaproteobacteria bacterium]|nr:sodium:alanine symporter family protein [Gammaproteobacteria bacterium]
MESITTILNTINGYVWGPFTLILLLGTGIYLTIGLRLLTLRKLVTGFRYLWQSRKSSDAEGDITPFNALMTALSATVGTGNIVGVAGAIAIGGPGAIFWMWITALVGMATKYAEAVLAVKYREVDERGRHQGGPMYYIRNGLGKNWAWLAVIFALFGAIAAFGIGNGVQSNSVANVLNKNFEIETWVTGLILSVLTALVLIGGIKRIGTIAGKIVPVMALLYVIAALIIIFGNLSNVPAALGMIISDAFTGTAATG